MKNEIENLKISNEKLDIELGEIMKQIRQEAKDAGVSEYLYGHGMYGCAGYELRERQDGIYKELERNRNRISLLNTLIEYENVPDGTFIDSRGLFMGRRNMPNLEEGVFELPNGRKLVIMEFKTSTNSYGYLLNTFGKAVSVALPKNKIGDAIGKQGVRIKRLCALNGARINIIEEN